MNTIVNYFLHPNSENSKHFLKENPIISTKLTKKKSARTTFKAALQK